MRWTVPNILTLLRLIAAPAVPLMFLYFHRPWADWAALTLFVLAALMSIKPSLDFRRWLKNLNADGSLPPEDAVRRTRRWIMWQSHLIPVIAVIAVFWARGW